MIYTIENIKDEKFTEELFHNAYLKMSEKRKEKADRYPFDSDRKLCVFSDYILRNMLKSFSVYEPEFYINTKGKPGLIGDKVHFNISHSQSFIACVADTKPVGIDIEAFREVSLSLINKVCTPQELDFVLGKRNNSTMDKSVHTRFFQVWTAKEAYLKYTGEGLSGGLKSICVANENGLKSMICEGIYLINEHTELYSLSVVSESPGSLT